MADSGIMFYMILVTGLHTCVGCNKSVLYRKRVMYVMVIPSLKNSRRKAKGCVIHNLCQFYFYLQVLPSGSKVGVDPWVITNGKYHLLVKSGMCYLSKPIVYSFIFASIWLHII